MENPNQLKGAGYKRQLRVLEMREGAGAITRTREWLELSAETAWWWQGRGLSICPGHTGNDFAKRGCQTTLVRSVWGRAVVMLVGARSWLRETTRVAFPHRRVTGVCTSARGNHAYLTSGLLPGWDHGLATVLEGDWLQQRCSEAVHSRPVVRVEDPEQAAKRVESWESVVMGPLWGGSYEASSGAALAHEQQVLEAAGPTPSKRCRGGLRAIRFQPKSSTIEKRGDDLVLNCQLPVDSFVAVMAEEFIHCEGHLQ